MHWNPNWMHIGHVAIEAALAALAWVLYRRLNHAWRLLAVVETELGLARKRFEAATSGFHIRLLAVERQSKLSAGAAAGAGWSQARAGLAAPPAGALVRRPSEPVRLNRGEWDLMRKVRQLNGE